jgi:hypothetical protein
MVPVAALAFHYGPGQRLFRQDLAASLQQNARSLEAEATRLQAQAYQAHLAALEARRRSFANDTPETQAAATAAAQAEGTAFKASSEAWKAVADAHGRILAAATDAPPQTLRKIRWSRSRALVRAGDIWTGIGELEGMLEEIETEGGKDSDMAWATREEIGAAYYYGARLLRLAGEAEEDWRADSGKARQHFRYLAERARQRHLPDEAVRNQERNVELVLDLEQSSEMELRGKPLPKDSPTGRNGNRPGNRPGKRKQPPTQRDGRGAGGAEGIFTGW